MKSRLCSRYTGILWIGRCQSVTDNIWYTVHPCAYNWMYIGAWFIFNSLWPSDVSGRVTIGPGNGLSPVQLQAGQCWFIVNKIPKNQLKWNLNFKMQSFSYSTMNLKMLSAKCRPFCSGLRLLMSTHSLPRKFSGWVNIRYVFPNINYIVLQQQ